MPKKGGFAAKVMKASQKKAGECPVCGEVKSYIKQVRSEFDPVKNSYRFREKVIAVCKCNSNEVYS